MRGEAEPRPHRARPLADGGHGAASGRCCRGCSRCGNGSSGNQPECDLPAVRFFTRPGSVRFTTAANTWQPWIVRVPEVPFPPRRRRYPRPNFGDRDHWRPSRAPMGTAVRIQPTLCAGKLPHKFGRRCNEWVTGDPIFSIRWGADGQVTSCRCDMLAPTPAGEYTAVSKCPQPACAGTLYARSSWGKIDE